MNTFLKVFNYLILFIFIVFFSQIFLFSADNKNSSPQIVISELTAKPLQGRDCKVEVTLTAVYPKKQSKYQPDLWFNLSTGKEGVSLGFAQKTSDFKKVSDTTLKIIKKLSLSSMSKCSGRFKLKIWLKEGKLESNKLATEIVF